MTEGASAYIYLQDELGSPVRLLDMGGNHQTVYGYDEFGQDLFGDQGEMQPFGYTGYQKDKIVNTYFAQAREYLPGVGRFSGQDVVKGSRENPKTLNSYGYCWGNPIAWVDLDGRKGTTPSYGEVQKWGWDKWTQEKYKGVQAWKKSTADYWIDKYNTATSFVNSIVDINVESGFGVGVSVGAGGVKAEATSKMYKSWKINSDEFGKVDPVVQEKTGLDISVGDNYSIGAGVEHKDLLMDEVKSYFNLGIGDIKMEDDVKLTLISVSLYAGPGGGAEITINLSEIERKLGLVKELNCENTK